MFEESAKGPGWIEVVCGSMFSGKTEELIRRVRRSALARQSVMIFKPAMDTRYSIDKVVSHDANELKSIPIKSPVEILESATYVQVVGIDEAQFFDDSLVEVAQMLADRGIRVIVAGLDMDYLGKPFGPMPALMAVAESVTKLHAICLRCGAPAHHSHRLISSSNLVELGEKATYEPLCRHCFNEMMKKGH